MEFQMLNNPNQLKVHCDFTWIVGHEDRTTPSQNNNSGFQVFLTLSFVVFCVDKAFLLGLYYKAIPEVGISG